MGAELLFESRLTNRVLRQEGVMESQPCLSLQLALTDGPIIDVSDGAVLPPASWRLKIRRRAPGDVPPSANAATMTYRASRRLPSSPSVSRFRCRRRSSDRRLTALYRTAAQLDRPGCPGWTKIKTNSPTRAHHA